MIKKIGILAKNKFLVKDYKREIRKSGFKYLLKKADLILSIGGDGTLLESERKYPSIPKLMIKDSEVCAKCNPSLFGNYLDLIIDSKYKIVSHEKLECYVNGKKTRFLGVNDIIIRNSELTQAIRFDVYADNKKIDSYIGDGIVVSTPFGSSAYYNTITGKVFKKGLGVAFNNIKKVTKTKIFDDNTKIKLIINRGNAIVGCDNYRNKLRIKPYDEVVIKKVKKVLNLVILNSTKN